ncbi:hypothetical protein TUM17567_18350 [Citrobacter amalonaticus]|nr:hypothetical protein TUM17567_18350 [Citrobacter amalonaticus]
MRQWIDVFDHITNYHYGIATIQEIREMTRRYLRILLVGSLFSLSACAQQSEVRQMHQSVSTLNKEMNQLNQETVKITQQNSLNVKSTRGVYLLPGSNTPARLNSQIGTLRMSLINIAPNAAGTRVTLRIQGESNDPLPAFSGTVEYGQIQGTTDNYQEVNVQNQLINAPASVLAPSDVDIPLQLNNLTPDQLGFVRIHDIQPVTQ